ncbi:hypothetical protein SUGI_1515310, partial [Cryptomeria japonica]
MLPTIYVFLIFCCKGLSMPMKRMEVDPHHIMMNRVRSYRPSFTQKLETIAEEGNEDLAAAFGKACRIHMQIE